MMYRIKQLDHCRICAVDADVGRVTDVLFDDEHWVIRYLVVDLATGLPCRTVLISPYSFVRVDLDARVVAVNLTRRQVACSPEVDTDNPVSRWCELKYLQYYGYPAYWHYATLWPWGSAPMVVPPDTHNIRLAASDATALEDESAHSRFHLLSASDILGSEMQTRDDSFGEAEDVLFDTESWAIRFLVIATRKWWFGPHTLVSPRRIDAVDWTAHAIRVAMSGAEIHAVRRTDPEFQKALRQYYATY